MNPTSVPKGPAISRRLGVSVPIGGWGSGCWDKKGAVQMAVAPPMQYLQVLHLGSQQPECPGYVSRDVF